jgi:hypothetical protein
MNDIERLNVLSPRPRKDGKTYWLAIGTAFKSKDGEGWDVLFDAAPLPDEKGQTKVMLRPFKDKPQGSDAPF